MVTVTVSGSGDLLHQADPLCVDPRTSRCWRTRPAAVNGNAELACRRRDEMITDFLYPSPSPDMDPYPAPSSPHQHTQAPARHRRRPPPELASWPTGGRFQKSCRHPEDVREQIALPDLLQPGSSQGVSAPTLPGQSQMAWWRNPDVLAPGHTCKGLYHVLRGLICPGRYRPG